MAEHVWSVLCEHVLTDSETKSVSLIIVIERLGLPYEAAQELVGDPKETTGFLYPMQVVSWCVRSDYNKAEQFDLRAGWLCPGNDFLPLGEKHLAMEDFVGIRAKMQVKGVPWRGTGLYWLVVDKRDEGKDWINVARLPLEVVVRDAPEDSVSGE